MRMGGGEDEGLCRCGFGKWVIAPTCICARRYPSRCNGSCRVTHVLVGAMVHTEVNDAWYTV